MAIELWQVTIPNRKSKGLLVSAAPVTDPSNISYYGPYPTLKDARQSIESLFPIGHWVTARRYYTKVENEVPWD